MFEHFHARDHIKTSRLLSSKFFGADLTVKHVWCLCFQSMKLGNF